MKTPDEIKKALECCFYDSAQCGECPYYPVSCDRELVRDAREYIQQLEAERDALIGTVRGSCYLCKYADMSFQGNDCANCIENQKCNWQWRGVQKED